MYMEQKNVCRSGFDVVKSSPYVLVIEATLMFVKKDEIV